jgi:adenylate cyclase
MVEPTRSDSDAGTLAGEPQAADPAEVVLRALLERYDTDPTARSAIEAEVDQRFRRPHAVLVLDSSGFTRTVKTKGIIHFLALLQRLERMVQPLIADHGGKIVAREGDTIFAIFDAPPDAIAAALDIQERVGTDNAKRPVDEQVTCAIGIGFGEILAIGDHRIAGDEVNVAFKLGEDLAEGGEILVSDAAMAEMPEHSLEIEPVAFTVSGVTIDAHRVTTPTT